MATPATLEPSSCIYIEKGSFPRLDPERLRRLVRDAGADELRQPEIEHEGPRPIAAVDDHDIGRLEVEMDDLALVGVGQRVEDLKHPVDRVAWRQRAVC